MGEHDGADVVDAESELADRTHDLVALTGEACVDQRDAGAVGDQGSS